jgi:hypothetical protein
MMDYATAITDTLSRSHRVLPIKDGPEGSRCMPPEDLENAVAGRYFCSEKPMDPAIFASTLDELRETGVIQEETYPQVYDLPGQEPQDYKVLVLH